MYHRITIKILLPVYYCYGSQDIKMLMKQCQRCYSQNRSAQHPVQVRSLINIPIGISTLSAILTLL